MRTSARVHAPLPNMQSTKVHLNLPHGGNNWNIALYILKLLQHINRAEWMKEFHIKSCRLALGLPAPLWIVKPGFHIVVSVVPVVSVVRKKFIGQIEFILSRTKSCICRFFCIDHLYIFYLSYEFFSYDRHDRYNHMETRL